MAIGEGGGEGIRKRTERPWPRFHRFLCKIYNPNITGPDYIEPHSSDWILIIALGTYHAPPPSALQQCASTQSIKSCRPSSREEEEALIFSPYIYIYFSFFALLFSSLISSLPPSPTQTLLPPTRFLFLSLSSDSTSFHFLLSNQITNRDRTSKIHPGINWFARNYACFRFRSIRRHSRHS